MIGVVIVDAGEYPPVLGVPAPLRAALTMQQAGASAVCFAGEGAAAWADAFRRDDRRDVEVIDGAPLREDPRVAVDGGVVFDRATLARAFASPCLAWIGDAVVLSHRSQGSDAVALVDDGAPDLELAPDALCLRAREPAEVALVEDGLLQRLRKPQDGVVARALNRSLSLAVTRVIARTPLRPNDLSLSILFVGLAGAALASTGERLPLALGGLLFQAQSVLDGCDGELARVTFRGSKLGEWIDTVGDDVTNYAYFGALGVGLHRAGLGEGALWLALAAVSLGSLCSLIEYRYLYAIGSGDLLKYPLGFGADPEPAAQATGLARLLGALRPLFKRDFFVFATMLAAFAGPRASLGMLAAFAVGAAFTLAAVLRSEWSRGFAVPRRGG